MLALRVPSALAGAAAMVPFYLLARSRCGRPAAVAGTVLLLGALWALSSSRQAGGEAWLVLGALVAVWAATRAEHSEHDWLWYALAGVSCGLVLLAPPGGRWLLVGLAGYVTWRGLARRQHRVAALLGSAILVALALLVVFLTQLPHPGGPATVWQAALLANGAGDQSWLARLLNPLRAVFLLDGGVVVGSELLPVGRSPFDAVTGVALLFGLWVAWRRRQAGLWLTLLALPLAGNALFGGATVALEEIALALPFAYLLATLGLERFLALPAARFGALQLLALALAPLVLLANGWEYYRWQSDPRGAPAGLLVREFNPWAQAQLLALAGGSLGPSVADWQRARGQSAAPSAPAAAQPAQPRPRPTVAPASALDWPLVTLLGRPGELVTPRGVAVAPNGDIYVADSGARQVLRFNADGDLQDSLAGQFAEPYDVEVSARGDVYVLDSQLGVVLRFDATGQPTGTLGGSLGAYHPRGLGLDRLNRLYIADTGRDRVLVLSPEGEPARHDREGGAGRRATHRRGGGRGGQRLRRRPHGRPGVQVRPGRPTAAGVGHQRRQHHRLLSPGHTGRRANRGERPARAAARHLHARR